MKMHYWRNNMSFDNVWKSQKIKDLDIKVYKGKSYNSSNLIVSDDLESVNYITRTEKNNGIKAKVFADGLDFVEDGNAITIGDTTASIFYQKEKFVVGEHIVILRADWFNEKIGNFIVTQLRKEKFRYPVFARAFIKDLIEDTEILLPINEDCSINTKEIENFVDNFDITSENILTKIPDYFLNEGYNKACWYLENINKNEFEDKYAGVNCEQKISLNDREWREYDLTNFFTPTQSKGDIKINEIVSGDIPLISAVKGNNGIATFVAVGDGKAQLFSKGCLTADMFGHVFYQPKDFYCVSHGRVNVLVPLIDLNVYQSIFVAKVLEYQFNIRNSYSRMLTKDLLKKCKISLPVIGNEPDWNFMESYIKSLKFSKNIE